MIDPAYICETLAMGISDVIDVSRKLNWLTPDPLGMAVMCLAKQHPSWSMMDTEERARIPFMACDQLSDLLPTLGLSAELDSLIAFREAWDGTRKLGEPPIPESQIGYHAPAYRAGNEFAHELRSELANG